METKKPIAILGAGLAGLTAANFLKQKNVPFVLSRQELRLQGSLQVLKMPMDLVTTLVRISLRIAWQMLLE